jgi:hypothetical protein
LTIFGVAVPAQATHSNATAAKSCGALMLAKFNYKQHAGCVSSQLYKPFLTYLLHFLGNVGVRVLSKSVTVKRKHSLLELSVNTKKTLTDV